LLVCVKWQLIAARNRFPKSLANWTRPTLHLPLNVSLSVRAASLSLSRSIHCFCDDWVKREELILIVLSVLSLLWRAIICVLNYTFSFTADGLGEPCIYLSNPLRYRYTNPQVADERKQTAANDEVSRGAVEFDVCCVSVCLTGARRLIASVRLEPQVVLPGGSVPRHLDDQQGRQESVEALRVDRFTVTNADFMYVLHLVTVPCVTV